MADRRGTAPKSGAPDGSGHGEMVSKKSRGSKPPTRSQIKRDARKLKSLGLYDGDLRKKPTRYLIGQTKKFRDVLSGSAKVVSMPSRKAAKEYKSSFKTKGTKIIVPTVKGDRITYSKKSGEIVTRRTRHERKLRIVHPKRLRSVRDLDKLPQGPNITYRMPIGVGGAMETMTYAEVKKFYHEYSKRGAKGGKHSLDFMRVYLQIVYDETGDVQDVEDTDYEDIYGDENDE